MQCVVVLGLLLLSVTCAERNCSTWLHPSGDGQCLCGPSLGTVVVCNNEIREVGVLGSHCLTSSGDGSNTSVVGRCLVVLHHEERLLSPVGIYDKVLPNISEQDQQTCGYSTARDDCVASVNTITLYLHILMTYNVTTVHPLCGVVL